MMQLVFFCTLVGASSLLAPRTAARSTLRQSSPELTTAEEAVLTESQRASRIQELKFTPTRYFFGRVSVWLGPEFKPLSETFDPTYKDDTSAVGAVVVEAPFGMIIEESGTHAGKIEVMEVVADGNAAKAGVQAGDILRGTTAMALNIEKSSEEDFGFSVGFSEGKRSRGFLNVDRKKFDLVMAALKSNAISNSGPGEATLVFERRVKQPEDEASESESE